jgi:hypothetical protein
MTDKPKRVSVTIRLERDLWKAIRKLEEDRLVDSIQDACVKGLILLCNLKKREEEER